MLRFFQEQGFDAKPLKFNRDGEYEYDVLVPWDDHVFILECKNRTLSGHNPVAAYYFLLEMESAIKQVNRLSKGLIENADLVRERTGIEINGKKVVSCVVNSLPYAMKGDHDGIYISDASSLKRFFQSRHFNVSRLHRLYRDAKILHRTAMKSLWSGEKPSPADLVAYLGYPLQLQLMSAHTQRTRHEFSLGETTVVHVDDLMHKEITTSSIAKVFSVDEGWAERENAAVSKAIRAAQKQYEQRAIRKADRAWRTQQQRLKE